MGQDMLCAWGCKAPRYQSQVMLVWDGAGHPEGDKEGRGGKEVQSSLMGAAGAPAHPCV